MMTLSKGAGEQLWHTDNYELRPNADNFGYQIININTGVNEMMVDSEPQAIMAMMWMEEQYQEVMLDPEREFKVRRQNRQPMAASKMVQ